MGNAVGPDGSHSYNAVEEPWDKGSEPFITGNQQASLLPLGREGLYSSHVMITLT